MEFSDDDLEYLAKYLTRTQPQTFSNSWESLLLSMKSDLKNEHGKHFSTISLSVNKNFPIGRSGLTLNYNGNPNVVPQWYSTLGSSNFFAVYLRSHQQIQETNLTIFNASEDQNTLSQVVGGEKSLSQRTAIATIQLGQILSQLTLSEIWNNYRSNGGSFTTVKEVLDPINEVIEPLEMTFQDEGLQTGNIFFVIRNKKSGKQYSLNYASSGERHVIALAATLIQWQRQKFKSIILIDEPEIHLHPDYISKLGALFSKVFGPENSYTCMVATHSPDFIATNPDRVFQISVDSKTIVPVENLPQRVALFEALGKKFDLSFLIKRIVWVEGVTSPSKDHLQDHEVYQYLIDPNKVTTVFLPAGVDPSRDGSKEGVRAAMKGSSIFLEFIKSVSSIDSGLNIIALVDKDDDKGAIKSLTIKYTPFTNLENIFLLDFQAVAEAASLEGKKQYTPIEISKILDNITGQTSTQTMSVNGKKVFDSLYGTLFTIPDISHKEFQERILKKILVERLPQEVKDLFAELRA